MKSWVIIALLWLLPLWGRAAPYNIIDALFDTLEKDNRLSSAQVDVKASEEQKIQAKSAYLPQISTINSIGQTRTNRFNQNLVTSSNPSGKDTSVINGLNKTFGLRVEQKLYDFGRTDALIERTDTVISQSKIQEKLIEQTVVFDAVQAYLTVLENLETEKLFRESRTVNEKQLAIAQFKYEHNELRANLYNQIKSRIGQSSAEYLTSRAELAIAISALEQLTNKTLGEQEFSYQKIEEILQGVGGDVISSRAQAEQFNFTIKSSKAQLELARAERKFSASQSTIWGIGLPDLSLSGNVSKSYFGNLINDTNTSLTLNASSQLYDGGAKVSRFRESDKRLVSAGYNVSEVTNRVNLEIHNIHRRIEAAQEISHEWYRAANELKLTMQNLSDAMELGAVTFIEYLNALDDFNKAKVQVIKNNIQIYRLKFQLLQLIGILTKDNLEKYRKNNG